MLTEEAFQGWKADPVTQDYYKLLREWRAALMEQWAAGQFQQESRDSILILNAAALGELRAYERLEELDYEQIEETLRDD